MTWTLPNTLASLDLMLPAGAAEESSLPIAHMLSFFEEHDSVLSSASTAIAVPHDPLSCRLASRDSLELYRSGARHAGARVRHLQSVLFLHPGHRDGGFVRPRADAAAVS